ncbi:transmembrane protein [Mycobacterium tuberculosis T85]|nr:transmembrane protein [Mycobacterium tuberculosis T85]
MVSTLSGDVAGAVGGYAGRGALAYTGAPAGADGLRHAAHTAAASPRFSADSGATRGGTAAA